MKLNITYIGWGLILLFSIIILINAQTIKRQILNSTKIQEGMDGFGGWGESSSTDTTTTTPTTSSGSSDIKELKSNRNEILKMLVKKINILLKTIDTGDPDTDVSKFLDNTVTTEYMETIAILDSIITLSNSSSTK